MIYRILIILILNFGCASGLLAHPHAFMECQLSFVMDSDGLVGIKQRWVLDEMTTVSILDVVDKNHDGVLTAGEKSAVRQLSIDSLLEYHYFTVVRINSKKYPVKKITGFSAELEDGKLIYTFLVPCRVEAKPERSQEVKVAVFDDSFFTVVIYAEEGGADIDPTKDPLYANREAAARPEDFKRFSSAVGLSKFKGKVKVTGDVSNFKISSRVSDEPDMAYFYDQITPQAFVLLFEKQ